MSIDFLIKEETQDILSQYAGVTDPLKIRSLLKKRFTDDECVVMSQQIVLRQRAKNKFHNPEKMLFDREGYEQATHECVAAYHAELFDENDEVLDVCTGIGSDVVALSRKVKHVVTIDSNSERLAFAEYNVTHLGNQCNCDFICSEVELYTPATTISALYADPSRRVSGRRRIELEDYSPTVSTIMTLADNLCIEDGKCVIKLAPACDYDELLEYGRIEVISLDGEVKEVLFFRDSERAGEVHAIVLHDNSCTPEVVCTVAASDDVYKKVSGPQDYIIEPDNAIIRAGVIAELAEQFQGAFLQAQTAYLTAAKKGDEKGYKAYSVVDSFDFSAKKVKKYLKDKRIEALSVKKRGINETAEELQKKIGIKRGSNTLFLFVYRVGDKYKASLAERKP